MSEILIFSIIQTILCIIPTVLHLFGIYWIQKSRHIDANQKHYISHISLLEIVIMICQNIFVYLKVYGYDVTYYYVSLFSAAVGFVWNNILIMLTVDRFLQVYLNIKYVNHVTRAKTLISISMCYLLGICSVLILVLVNTNLHISHEIIRLYFYSFYAAVVCIVFGLTYLYIYYRIRVCRNADDALCKSQHSNLKDSQKKQQQPKRGTFIPFWIVFTYILFIVIPGIIYVVLFTVLKIEISLGTKLMVYHIWRVCWLIAFTTDAMIYILSHERIRRKFVRLLKCFKAERQNSLILRYESTTSTV